MSLAEMTWTRVSVHEIVHKFLIAERETRLNQVWAYSLPALVRTQGLGRILDQPNFSSPAENHARLRLLCLIRRWLICELPPDTEWYEVRFLTDDELFELRIMARCGLDGWAERNELMKVRQHIPLMRPPAEWNSLFLFGHDQLGPFTIIEGYHRLASYVASERKGLKIPVYVGLSLNPFFFNPLDIPEKLVNELWR